MWGANKNSFFIDSCLKPQERQQKSKHRDFLWHNYQLFFKIAILSYLKKFQTSILRQFRKRYRTKKLRSKRLRSKKREPKERRNNRGENFENQ
jgi:hypothetical protein